MADTVTAPQKVLLRSEKKFSQLYLAIPNPAVIFARRVNEPTVAANDMRASITYDNPDGGAGVFGSVLPGQMLHIGSIAGGYDRGQARIRAAATASVLAIGEQSECDVHDNDFLTVIDDFAPWQRHVKITAAGVVKMDYDVAYTNQHTVCDPVPVMGADAVLWYQGTLGGGNSITVTFDDADSWALGSTIASRVWSRLPTAGSAISSTTASAPTFTFTAPGTFRIKNTMTSTAGAVFAGYRKVVVYDNTSLPMTDFRLDGCGGDWDSGGWSFRVTLFANFDISQIRDRAQVFLCARDWYGGVEGSVSTDTGRGNILAAGWIIGESITSDPEQSTVSFEVATANRWLSNMPAFPIGLEYNATASWTGMTSLTVDRAVWHLLHWQSTIDAITDFRKSDDTRLAAELTATAGNLWGQITELAETSILARPCCNHLGKLWVEIPTNLLPTGSRSTIPTVMTLTTADYLKTITFERRSTPLVSQVDSSGVAVDSTGNGSALFSLSNGHVPKRWGAPQRRDRLLLSTQSQSNILAGLILGSENNTYVFNIPLSANNRVFDICPNQYAPLNTTFRGITFNGNVLPRSVDYSHNPTTGVLSVELSVIAETTGESYTNGDIPSAPTPPPTFPPIPPPPPPPPPSNPVGVIPVRALFAHTKAGVYYCENVNDIGTKVWKSLNGILTALESAAIIGMGVHRLGNYVYAISPAYMLQAWFVELAATQFGLSIVMTRDNIRNMIGLLPAVNVDFASVGVHPYSGEGLFNINKPAATEDHRFFHFDTNLVVTAGAAVSTNIDLSPVLSWGDSEAIVGTVGGGGSGGSGFLATSDYGVTTTYYPIRSTSGSYFRIARADVSKSFGAVADEAYAKTQNTADNGHTLTDRSTTYIPINEPASAFPWAANPDNSIGLATIRKISGGTYWLASTADGGATWTELASQASGNLFRGFCHIYETIWMWGDDTKIYLSLDNGATNTDITGNLLTDFPGIGGVIDIRQLEFMA